MLNKILFIYLFNFKLKMSKTISYIVDENTKINNYEKNINDKEKEIEDFFYQIQKENEELKSELIKYKLELEKEREITQTLKDTYLNINCFDDPTNNIDVIIYENIKFIKEENEKKLNELNLSYENLVKSTKKENLQIKNSIRETLENFDNKLSISINSNMTQSIFDDIEKYENKIESLLEINFNKEKYSLMLNQKFELVTEENNFLKGKIMQEKINLIEKISNFNIENSLTNMEIIKNLLNELDEEKNNFFNNQFLIPIESLSQSLNESRQNEKILKEQNEKMKIMCDELKNKLENIIIEKNNIIEKSKGLLIESEKKYSKEKALYSEISKLKKEIEILTNKNDYLLKTNTSLNEQIENINNRIEFQIKTKSNENDILINQKNLMIEELSNKLVKSKFEIENYEKRIEELNEEINQIKNNLSDDSDNENYYQKQSKNQRINKNIKVKNINFDNEFITIKNEKECIEKNFNNLNNEYNMLKNNMIILSKEKEELENNNNNLKKLLSQNEKNKLLNNDNELLKNIQKNIRQIYQIHFNKNEINSKNDLIMLKEINEKLSQKQVIQTLKIKDEFPLEQSENSQFYENLILYISNLKCQHKLEIGKIINEYENKEKTTIDYYDKSGITTNINSSVNTIGNNYRKTIEELKSFLEEKYEQLEDRIRTSCSVEDLEKILLEIKYLYEQIIEYIIQSFYNSKTDLSNNNILTIQIQLEKYHQIINNTNGNLSKIEQYINKKIIEYRNQGNKIESSFSILLKYVNDAK